MRGRGRRSGPTVLATRVPAASFLGVSLVTASLLAGCTEVPPELSKLADMIGPPTRSRFVDGVPAHAGVPPESIVQEAAPPAEPPPITTASVAPGQSRAPLNDVRELIGLAPNELQARLGDPALRRRDAPAEIWQYRSPLCVLDLFLYREGAATRVTNAELRPRDGRELPAATCLSSL